MSENAEAIKIVFADANFVPHKELIEASLPQGASISWHPAFDEAAVIADLPGAQVYVGAKFTKAMTAAADALRLVHVGGAGYDGIDAEALPAGVVVANTFHHEKSIAEYVAATSIVVRRQLYAQDRALRSGHWASSVYEPEREQLSTLEGATVGIFGYGHIGSNTWRVMRAFGARGVTVTPREVDVAREGLDWAGGSEATDRLLVESDIVVLCLPLLPSTHYMIARTQFEKMKKTAVLVNVSRGPLVDPDALYAALRERRIGGAVLDVWYQYPASGSHAQPSPLPFAELENVVMTPHISGVTRNTFEGRARDIAANIGRVAAGEPIKNVVICR